VEQAGVKARDRSQLSPKFNRHNSFFRVTTHSLHRAELRLSTIEKLAIRPPFHEIREEFAGSVRCGGSGVTWGRCGCWRGRI
jgi:hypothetical protein